MTAYYNENDPYPAQWLRNLMAVGLVPQGDVDERSIEDVSGDDLKSYDQCHFFAGLGGWLRALKIAGWPADRPVWTGSCPCQPFSVAGSQKGFEDKRHLWPYFRRLIAERRPTEIFGEQVASAAKWLNLVRTDLEEMGYAVGAIPLQAACEDADHFRDRYWFVANSNSKCQENGKLQRSWKFSGSSGNQEDSDSPMANINDTQRRSEKPAGNFGLRTETEWNEGNGNASECSDSVVVNNQVNGWGEGWTEHEFRSRGFTAAVASIGGSQYVECSDGKWRRLPPPRVRWLGNGIRSRVAKLRAIGNAIDPRPASAFIRAYLDCSP